jgi:hypothetical protein
MAFSGRKYQLKNSLGSAGSLSHAESSEVKKPSVMAAKLAAIKPYATLMIAGWPADLLNHQWWPVEIHSRIRRPRVPESWLRHCRKGIGTAWRFADHEPYVGVSSPVGRIIDRKRHMRMILASLNPQMYRRPSRYAYRFEETVQFRRRAVNNRGETGQLLRARINVESRTHRALSRSAAEFNGE